jgi:hypothetical protein
MVDFKVLDKTDERRGIVVEAKACGRPLFDHVGVPLGEFVTLSEVVVFS